MTSKLAEKPKIIHKSISATSPEAVELNKTEKSMDETHSPSYSDEWKNYLIEDGRNLYFEKHEENWDNEGAVPVQATSLKLAENFINQLTDDIEEPEISADPDGTLELEWNSEPGKILTLSFGQDTISYAGYFGPSNKNHGVREFQEEIPDEITKIFKDHFLRKKNG